MLEVSVDKIVPTPTSLRLGLRVQYGKDGPVRFAQASVDYALLTPSTMADVYGHLLRLWNAALDAEPEAGEDDPLF